MRPLDLFLAFEKKTFDERIGKLDEPTRGRFKKWLLMDILLGFVVHLFVALLALWCMSVYTNDVFIYIFYILALAQGISFVFHLIADIIMQKSVDARKLGMSIYTYNTIVILKLAIPLIGLFMCVTTLILVWFQFMFSHTLPMATMFFLLPIFIVTMIIIRVMTGARGKKGKAKTV
jgi:amino acid permease